METEVVTEAVTEAVTEQLPAVTEAVTNAVEVFMYDVSQYNNNSAGFFDSVAKYANNIIHSIKSFESYFVWIRVGIESLIQRNEKNNEPRRRADPPTPRTLSAISRTL